MNILQVTAAFPPNFAFGGRTVATGAMANGLQRLGHRIITIASNLNGEDFAEIPKHIEDLGENISGNYRTMIRHIESMALSFGDSV